MRDLDLRHAGRVERGSDAHHLIDRYLLALGVHAVAQGHVVQQDLAAPEIDLAHATASSATGCNLMVPARISSANISAVRVAAAVMMSRLPAYFGR